MNQPTIEALPLLVVALKKLLEGLQLGGDLLLLLEKRFEGGLIRRRRGERRLTRCPGGPFILHFRSAGLRLRGRNLDDVEDIRGSSGGYLLLLWQSHEPPHAYVGLMAPSSAVIAQVTLVSSILLCVPRGATAEAAPLHCFEEVIPRLPIAPGRVYVHGVGVLGGGGERCR